MKKKYKDRLTSTIKLSQQSSQKIIDSRQLLDNAKKLLEND